MPKWTRICSLNRAKVAMTTAATTTPVMARKTGSHRPGSVITSSVTKLVARKNGSIMGSAGQGPADAEPLCPTAEATPEGSCRWREAPTKPEVSEHGAADGHPGGGRGAGGRRAGVVDPGRQAIRAWGAVPARPGGGSP